MRTALVLLLIFTCGSAYAEDRCFRLTPKTEITSLNNIFPTVLIFREEPRNGMFAGQERKELSWVGSASKEHYSDYSFWEASGKKLIAMLRSEFDGFRIEFDLGTTEAIGTAQPFADIPGDLPAYNIQVTTIACP